MAAANAAGAAEQQRRAADAAADADAERKRAADAATKVHINLSDNYFFYQSHNFTIIHFH